MNRCGIMSVLGKRLRDNVDFRLPVTKYDAVFHFAAFDHASQHNPCFELWHNLCWHDNEANEPAPAITPRSVVDEQPAPAPAAAPQEPPGDLGGEQPGSAEVGVEDPVDQLQRHAVRAGGVVVLGVDLHGLETAPAVAATVPMQVINPKNIIIRMPLK